MAPRGRGRNDQRLHRQAMAHYLAEIVSGRLPAGERLPRETDIADRFDISRGITRECLRALEERGLITVRHGSKTRVNPRAEWDLFDPDVIAASLVGPPAVELLAEYLECRRIVEVEAAGLAAERGGEESVAALERHLASIEASLSLKAAAERDAAYLEAVVAFRVTLIEAGGNLALLALARRVDGALQAADYPLPPPAYRRTRALPEHEAILAAVRAGDSEGARVAMRAHLDSVERYLHEHARKLAGAA